MAASSSDDSNTISNDSNTVNTINNNDSNTITNTINYDQLGPIPYPTSLSPSSILEFQHCPRSFLHQYLYKSIQQPPSPVLTKGRLCHKALEQVFDLEPQHRTRTHLHNLLRKAWAQERSDELCGTFFDHSIPQEQVWGRESLQLLDHYLAYEDPATVEPEHKELWVSADLAVDPKMGVTGYLHATHDTVDSIDTFRVRGIIDRLDLERDHHNAVVWRLWDYKTGQAPTLKYSPETNHRILDQTFFQLSLYALLLRETGDETIPVRYLRLLFLKGNDQAQPLDFDLGATPEERDRHLQDVHARVAGVWQELVELVSQQDPHAFHGCQRPFCYVCRNYS